MAQQLVLSALAEDLGSVPTAHIRQLPAAVTSVAGGPMPSGLCRHLHICAAHNLMKAHTST